MFHLGYTFVSQSCAKAIVHRVCLLLSNSPVHELPGDIAVAYNQHRASVEREAFWDACALLAERVLEGIVVTQGRQGEEDRVLRHGEGVAGAAGGDVGYADAQISGRWDVNGIHAHPKLDDELEARGSAHHGTRDGHGNGHHHVRLGEVFGCLCPVTLNHLRVQQMIYVSQRSGSRQYKQVLSPLLTSTPWSVRPTAAWVRRNPESMSCVQNRTRSGCCPSDDPATSLELAEAVHRRGWCAGGPVNRQCGNARAAVVACGQGVVLRIMLSKFRHTSRDLNNYWHQDGMIT